MCLKFVMHRYFLIIYFQFTSISMEDLFFFFVIGLFFSPTDLPAIRYLK